MRKVALVIVAAFGLVLAVLACLVVVGVYRHGRSDEIAGSVIWLAQICEAAQPPTASDADVLTAFRQLNLPEPEKQLQRALHGRDPIEIIVVHASAARLAYAVAAYGRRDWRELAQRPLTERLAHAQWLFFNGEWLRTQEHGSPHDSPGLKHALQVISAGV